MTNIKTDILQSRQPLSSVFRTNDVWLIIC